MLGEEDNRIVESAIDDIGTLIRILTNILGP